MALQNPGYPMKNLKFAAFFLLAPVFLFIFGGKVLSFIYPLSKMKILLLGFVWAFVAGFSAQGQLLSKPPAMMTDAELGQLCLKKAKTQKTWGWILVGASAGFYMGASAAMKDEKVYTTENKTGQILFLMGTGSLIGSIPLFSNASRNKGRADILLQMKNGPGSKAPQARAAYPAIGIGLKLGK